MEQLPADDGATRRLWYWCFVDEQHGKYVRLNTSYSMEKFNPQTAHWEPMNDNYLMRAVQDPEFIEVSQLTQ